MTRSESIKRYLATLTPEQMHKRMSILGKKRQSSMTPLQRQEFSKKGVEARKNKQLIT